MTTGIGACAVTVISSIAALSALASAACAYLSYRLSKSIYREFKSDEVIIAGPLHHPGLTRADHDRCVLRCAVFNKSKRKAYITSVEVFDNRNANIPIVWSNNMDKHGNPVQPTGLLGLEDSANLVIRRKDSEAFGKTIVRIKHSFSPKMLEVVYDPTAWEDGDDQ